MGSDSAPLARRVRPRLKLTPREALFVRAFVEADAAHLGRFARALAAARAAGYEGMDERAVSELLGRARIRRAVERALARRLPGKNAILSELSSVATAPWKDFVTLKLDDQGNTVRAILDLRERNKAGEIILRAQGAFDDPVKRALGELLLAEVRKLAAARKQARAAGVSLPDIPPAPAPVAEQRIIDVSARDVSQHDTSLSPAPVVPESHLSQHDTLPLSPPPFHRPRR